MVQKADGTEKTSRTDLSAGRDTLAREALGTIDLAGGECRLVRLLAERRREQ